MYSASIWTVVFRTSTSFKNWVLPICFPPPCPLDFKIWSLQQTFWGLSIYCEAQQYSKMENSGLKGPRIRIFFDCIGRFCFNNPGAKKCPEMAIVFHFFGYVMCFSFFCSYFFLDWTWVSKLWKLMASQAPTVQKKFLSIKPRTQVQLVSTCLSNSPTIKSETRYPNIKGPHVSKEFVKPSFWRSWF